jgi:hypothetical protein
MHVSIWGYAMRTTEQTYFTVFEGTFSRQVAVRRKPVEAPSRTTGTALAVLLALAVLGGTTAGALTRHKAASSDHSSYSANFIKLPMAGSFEEALY